MSKAKTGDYVKVICEEEEFQGILMPRPEILEKGIVILKLDSGYNIGIDEKKIKSIELIKEHKVIEPKKTKLKHNPKLPTVSILSTGGTISSKIDYRTGGVYADYTAEDFVSMCPELEEIANLKAKKVMGAMSEDFTHNDWQEMAKHLLKELNNDEVDGIVLTMGTDMMHFAAHALSFFIEDINKPILITGSQRSIDRGSSDAFMNLICSVNAAANFDYAGVAVCMHGSSDDEYCLVNRGTKVRKMHTSRRDAFRPINELPLAKVFYDGKIDILNKDYEHKSDKKAKLDSEFEEKTGLLYVYPGMDPELIDFFVKRKYKGLVIAATALGHVPTNGKKSIISNIKKAVEKGVSVVISSQTLYGAVHPYVYTNLRILSMSAGAIYVEDMHPEVAFVKLGWVLGKTDDKEKVKEMMQKNLKGERSSRRDYESFLY